jgi:hypothetical protein
MFNNSISIRSISKPQSLTGVEAEAYRLDME